MQTTTETSDTHRQAITDLTATLAATAERLVTNITAADPDTVGMATAGAMLAATDRLTAAAVEVLARVSHRGVIADEGLSTGAWLRTFAARTTADERMLTNTAERLADMPGLRARFRDGEISWSAVRGIVLAVRNLTREQRRWVDATLTGDPDRVRRRDADDLVGAAQSLADAARPDLHRDGERRGFEQQYFRWEKAFDGSCRGSFALGAEETAILESAFADMQHAATNHHDTADHGDNDDEHGHHGSDDDGHHDDEHGHHDSRHDGGHGDNGAVTTAARVTVGSRAIGSRTTARGPTPKPCSRCAANASAWTAAPHHHPPDHPCCCSPTSPRSPATPTTASAPPPPNCCRDPPPDPSN
jgi:hypothetical protein